MVFRLESRKCPVCREETKMVIQVYKGETDDIPGDNYPVCYKGGRHGICFVHDSTGRNI